MTGNGGTASRVADRYRLERRIGRGGAGAVWRAHDEHLDRRVAVKQIPITSDAEASSRGRAMREARAAARLHVPNVVQVFDVIEEDGNVYLIMELVEAPNLNSLVRRKGPLPPADVAVLGLQILEALEAAHRAGIVHRDVKPSNVLMHGVTARLTDFGIARLSDDPTLTATGVVMGTPAYIAPEHAQGSDIGPAVDLYGLGATLYYAVEGTSPFRAEGSLSTVMAVINDPPRTPTRAGPLRDLLLELLAKDPLARPGPEDIRNRLEEIAGARPRRRDVDAPWVARTAAAVAATETARTDEPWADEDTDPALPGGAAAVVPGAPGTPAVTGTPGVPGTPGGAGAASAAGSAPVADDTDRVAVAGRNGTAVDDEDVAAPTPAADRADRAPPAADREAAEPGPVSDADVAVSDADAEAVTPDAEIAARADAPAAAPDAPADAPDAPAAPEADAPAGAPEADAPAGAPEDGASDADAPADAPDVPAGDAPGTDIPVTAPAAAGRAPEVTASEATPPDTAAAEAPAPGAAEPQTARPVAAPDAGEDRVEAVAAAGTAARAGERPSAPPVPDATGDGVAAKGPAGDGVAAKGPAGAGTAAKAPAGVGVAARGATGDPTVEDAAHRRTTQSAKASTVAAPGGVRPQRRRVAIMASVLGVLLLVAVALTAWLSRGDEGADDDDRGPAGAAAPERSERPSPDDGAAAVASPTPEASPTPSPSPSPSPTETEPPEEDAGDGVLPPTDTPVPSDWVEYAPDDAPYTLRHPPGWQVSRVSETITDISDPNSSTYLRLDWVDEKRDPVGAWEEFEPSFAARHSNYRNLGITETEFKGDRAALWEYRYSDGGAQLHAYNLGVNADDHGFALNLQTRQGDWEESQELWAQFLSSYEFTR